MVDNISLLIAHAALIYIAVRAIFLDNSIPWFETAEEEAERNAEEAAAKARIGPRRRGRHL